MNFQKPKGQRLCKRFFGIRVIGFWWNKTLNRWERDADIAGGQYNYSNYRECNSVKAFRRNLRKNSDIRGKATLDSIYIGFNVQG